MRMAKKAGNSYPYLLVEEGLKKNHASDRLRTFISSKISRRAQIEYNYMRELQDLVDEIRPLNDCTNNDYLDTEVCRRILGNMKQEASGLVEARKQAHNTLLSEDGPYAMLQRPGCTNPLPVTLEDIDEEFAVMSHQRNSVEHAYRYNNEKKEHFSNQIEAIEGQLSQRSRIVTSRRPSTRSGPRKVDEIQEKLSKLRQKSEDLAERSEEMGKKLEEIESNTSGPLSVMDTQLQALENDRIRYIIDHVNSYLDCIQPAPVQGHEQKNSILTSLEGLLKVNWVDVRTNAKRTERGDPVKYAELFEVKPNKLDLCKGTGMSKGLARGSRSTRGGNLNLIHTDSLILQTLGASQSSLVDGAPDPCSIVLPGSTCETLTALPVAEKAHSKESIESLELPQEVHCIAGITRVDPYRQFKICEPEKKEPGPAHVIEYTAVTRFIPEEYESDEEQSPVDLDDVRLLAEVKVVATQDSNPEPGTNQLCFKTGQMIKQKRSMDSYGMCYGWTREGRIGKKTFGFYKPSMVKLFKSNKQ